MNLSDTVNMMNSENYVESFKAEYHQLKIRYEELKELNDKIEAANKSAYSANKVEMPLFTCPEDILREQQDIMELYLHILEIRAIIENINLNADYNEFKIGRSESTIEHDGCVDCKHLSKTSQEDPCVRCKQNYIDKYERVKYK